MKKFTSMLLATFVAVAMFAGVPAKRLDLNANTLKGQKIENVGKVVAPRTIDASAMQIRKASKAESDYVIIKDQPEGELKTYVRSGGHYYLSGGSLYYEDQSGTIDIVFGAENKVYFKDIIAGLQLGTWVEGTLSADGTSITLPLKQNLYYVSDYDACIAIYLINYTGNGFELDKETASVTFSVADGVISLQGTGFASVSLGAAWTDDYSLQNYGDYASVFTPYTVNKTLVTLPDGLVPAEMPMEAKFYTSLDDYQNDNAQDVSATVKVAVDGTTYYFQGLVQAMPDAWVKGEMANNEVTIPVTYVGQDIESTDFWAMGYASSGPAEIVLTYDAVLNAYELDGYIMLSTSELENTLNGIYEGLYIGVRPDLVEVPQNATVSTLPFTATSSNGQSTSAISGEIQIAVDGEGNVYFQGLSQQAPTGWIKGKFNAAGDTLTFPYGQYVGVSTSYGSSVYLIGDNAETESVDDIKFEYNAAKNVYYSINTVYDNGKKDDFYYYAAYSDIVIGEDCDGIWVASEQNYENAQAVTSISIAEGITGLFAKADNPTNAPKYYDSGTAVRAYAGNTFTITADKPMAKIVITMSGNENQMCLEANVGTYTLEGNVGTWEGEAKEVVFTVPTGKQARIQKILVFYFDYASTLVVAPQDLETATYMLSATDTYENAPVTYEVNIGFYGNEVYFQGLSTYVPEGWLKGVLQTDGTIEIPGYYMGQYQSWFGAYDIVCSGAVLTYDSEADKFLADAFTTELASGSLMDELVDVTIIRVKEIAATPADPEITQFNGTSNYPSVRYNIPLLDVDGNALVTDKLSYQFFVQVGEDVSPLVLTTDLYTEIAQDMTEIPYSFSDDWDIYNNILYLNQGEEVMRSWDKLGLQTIYRGAGEERKSNIVWYDVKAYWAQVDGIDTDLDNINVEIKNAQYFDVLGRRVDASANGIVIKRVTLSDGTVKSEKVIRK